LLKHFVEQVPVETCIVALGALLAVARHVSFRDILINFNTIDTICLLLEVKNKYYVNIRAFSQDTFYTLNVALILTNYTQKFN